MRDDGRFVWATLAWTALVLAVALTGPGYADGPCVMDSCSDDSAGVLGNERLCWDDSDGATNYEIAADGALCVSVLAPATCDTILPTCRGDAVRVRACNEVGCSAWSDPVEVLPYACIRTTGCAYSDDGDSRNDGCQTCESRCFDGAPRRLPTLQECVP